MSSDVTALFRSYEVDYSRKSTDIARKVESITSLSGELRRAKTAEVENDIKSAESVIKSMDLEARSLPPDTSKQLLLKVKDYKADLSALRDRLKKAATSASTGDAARAELGLGGDYHSTSAGQRDRMLGATQVLQKTDEKLNFAKDQLREAEETGANILQNLHGQRETMVHARETLAGADDSISTARRILTGMARRAMQHKIIMYSVAGFLILGIIIILWARFK